MKPTWGVVACAAALGCVVGAMAMQALRRGGVAPPAAGDPAAARIGNSLDPSPAPAGRAGSPPRSPAAEREPSPPPDPEAEEAARVRGRIADLARARAAKDRKGFEDALRALFGEKDEAAHAALRDLVADPGFDFPDGHLAVWFGGSEALRDSPVPGWAAAARARYARDAGSPGCSWDAGAWLYLAAAHGDAEDLAWIASRYDTAPERPGEAVAALGAARPALAREALLREVRRQPPREGIWDAISLLGRRSPADAFAVLQAIVAEDLSLSHPDRGEILRSWARRAPGDALGEVRARIHAMAGAGSPAADLAPLVQVLADRGQDLSEFAGLLSSIGRELRRLVDEERRADGTGPYYAIEYNPVARTPDNLASLEYAIQVLGEGETRGCRKVLAEARAKSDWK